MSSPCPTEDERHEGDAAQMRDAYLDALDDEQKAGVE